MSAKQTDNAKSILSDLREALSTLNNNDPCVFINVSDLSRILGWSRQAVRDEFQSLQRYPKGKRWVYRLSEVANHLDAGKTYIRYGA